MAINTENTAISAMPVSPTILTQPLGGSVNVGAPFNFNVSAVGTATMGYQWYKNNQKIDGATGDTLIFDSIMRTNAGTYYVIVSNVVNTAKSSDASLYVIPPYTWDPVGRIITLNWYGKPGHTYPDLRSTSGNLAHPGNPAWSIECDVNPSNGNCSWYSPTLSGQTNGFYKVMDITGP